MSLLARLTGGRSTHDLSPAEAAAAAADGSIRLVDVREPDEIREGHCPDAELIPLGRLAAELPRLAKADTPVAFVCRSGARSSRAVAAAKVSGIDARNVTGGMMAWQRAGVPVHTGAPVKKKAKKKLF
ncbi:MAG: rhodanese-like domain-containing protein [Solirubrobacteraceae bacterium]|nr:rhodanese-like domain-containing protein [Solirubrobacteraceae bacterium]